jgi:hypothetical protein
MLSRVDEVVVDDVVAVVDVIVDVVGHSIGGGHIHCLSVVVVG